MALVKWGVWCRPHQLNHEVKRNLLGRARGSDGQPLLHSSWLCEMASFLRGVGEAVALLGCYAGEGSSFFF
jgi:hypothetical protein